ncbi:RNA-binding protein 12-like isoform X7 [Serinus canaria]|uniref:RNA-binding protein 12-like isoform X7 n=1 Tax=Serinus canaria TaxID=9135 RepID=UPI0021CCB839|nr:RNA-binding protein 12-like isoform X7 [Serinus canaria]
MAGSAGNAPEHPGSPVAQGGDIFHTLFQGVPGMGVRCVQDLTVRRVGCLGWGMSGSAGSRPGPSLASPSSCSFPSIPSVPIPEVPIPSVPIPSVPIPEVPIPSVPIPSVPIPEVPIPEVPIPSVPIPGVPIPGVPIPSMPIPSMPIPGVPIPGVPIPSVPIPSMPIPGVPIPEVPIPSVPIPKLSIPGAQHSQAAAAAPAAAIPSLANPEFLIPPPAPRPHFSSQCWICPSPTQEGAHPGFGKGSVAPSSGQILFFGDAEGISGGGSDWRRIREVLAKENSWICLKQWNVMDSSLPGTGTPRCSQKSQFTGRGYFQPLPMDLGGGGASPCPGSPQTGAQLLSWEKKVGWWNQGDSCGLGAVTP